MSSPAAENPNRRRFLKDTSKTLAVVSAAPAILSSTARAQNSDTLKVGLIGCGGRGTGAAGQSLSSDPNIVLTAMGDAFEDRLNSSYANLKEGFGDRVQVDEANKFVGFDAYQKVVDSGVDVVLLTTPPGFRPMHMEYAISQGKHVFAEKPMAVDGPGVRKVLAAAAEAKRKNLALVAGFCWRYNEGERALFRKIHDGEIGQPMSLHTIYNTGALWVRKRQPGWSDMMYQMRNWYYFTWLCGDHILEQACHSIDKMAWAMQPDMYDEASVEASLPAQCWASGGRQVRTGEEYGHIYDHFAVVYEYDNGVRGYHHCRQQPGCSNDNSDYFIGTKGIAQIKAFGDLTIRDTNNNGVWKFDGDRPNMYQVEHNEMIASIRKGEPINDGFWMAQSTLLALMGRMAAYTGRIVTRDEALNSLEDLMRYAMRQEDPEQPINFDWDMELRTPDVALPGVTMIL